MCGDQESEFRIGDVLLDKRVYAPGLNKNVNMLTIGDTQGGD